MLIRDQFRRAFFAIAAAITVACALMAAVYTQWELMAAARTWAHDVVRLTFHCHVFGSELVVRESARAKEQFRVSSDRLGSLLERPPGALKNNRFAREIASEKLILDRLLREAENGAEAAGALVAERRSMLQEQIVLQTTSMIAAAQALFREADTRADRLRFFTLIVVVASLAAIGATAGAAFYRVNRSLVGPLRQLSQGVQRFGAGELSFRLNMPRGDELGTLARSFDAMAGQLARRQGELQEKLNDLDTFCYSIAHDLKAPLRAVTGFGELLEQEHKGALGEEAASYITAMRKATLKMALLIDDLLEYGTLTHKDFAVSPVSLASLVGQQVADLQPELQRTKGAVEVAGELPLVLANEVVLRQILANLLANALKFVPPGRQPRIIVHAQDEGDWCRLSISDNGIGIAPEHQKTIFGLFQRLHRDSEYPGTGVGLAMVQKGMHLLGGTVGVESEPGQGSTFWLRLRRASARPGAT